LDKKWPFLTIREYIRYIKSNRLKNMIMIISIWIFFSSTESSVTRGLEWNVVKRFENCEWGKTSQKLSKDISNGSYEQVLNHRCLLATTKTTTTTTHINKILLPHFCNPFYNSEECVTDLDKLILPFCVNLR